MSVIACECDLEFGYCEVHVHCDDNCRALMNPTTHAEYTNAYEHWRHHSNDGGCAHGC